VLICVGCQTAANPFYEAGRDRQGGGGHAAEPQRGSGGASGTGGARSPAAAGTGGSVGEASDALPAVDVAAGADGALSADAIPALPFTGDVTKGLALYLPLDERPGTAVAADASGKKASAQLRSIDATAAWTVGAAGQALALQGTSWNGWVDVNGTALPSVLSGSFTVALWIRRPAAASNTAETLVSRTSLGAKGPLFALGLDAGVLNAQLNATAAYNLRLKANGTVPVDRWVHVAMTNDGQQVRLYVEGKAVGTGQYAQAVPLDTTSFMIGGLAQASGTVGLRFGGQIDEVLFYTRALTVNEIGGLASGAHPQTR
jgi:hypothetical protein